MYLQRRRLSIVMFLVLLFASVGTFLVTPANVAQAYDVPNGTNGSMTISAPADNTTTTKTWDSSTSYKIRTFTLNFSIRPNSPGSTTAADLVNIYYRTCSTCGYTYWGQINTIGENQTRDIDLSAYGATGIQVSLVTGTYNSSPLNVAVTCNSCSGSSPQWKSPGDQPITQIYFRGSSESCCDRVTVYGLKAGVWTNLFQASGTWGQAYSLTSYGAITGLYLSMSTDGSVISGCSCGEITQYDVGAGLVAVGTPPSYSASSNVPVVTTEEPPYAPLKPTLPSDTTKPAYQQTINWAAGSNAAGTIYELWRRTFDGSGAVVRDQKLYDGTALTYTTTDQVEGTYYRYRVRSKNSPGINLLDPNQANAESNLNGISAIQVGGTPTLTRDTAMFSSAEGRGSFKATATVASDLSINTSTQPTAIEGGRSYTFSVKAKSPAAAARQWKSTIYWLDGTGALISSHSSLAAKVASAYTAVTVSDTAPANAVAAYAELTLVNAAVSETISWDAAELEQSTSASIYTTPPRYSGFSPEAVYWTAPVPIVTPTYAGLKVTYSTVYPGLGYRINYRIAPSGGWVVPTTTDPNSFDIIGLSPVNNYNVAIDSVLPDGGTVWRTGNITTNYSPTYQAPSGILSTNSTPTSHYVYFRSDTTNITTSSTIRITRNGTQTYQAVPAYSWVTPPGGVYGLWGYFNDTNLSIGTMYDYLVCAVNALGVCGDTSALSFSPVPNVPTSLTLSTAITGVTQNNVQMSWLANANPVSTSYEVWRKEFRPDGSVVADIRIYSGKALNFITTDQMAGIYYSYRVIAVDSGVSSAPTAEAAYWTPPVPSVSTAVNSLGVTWNPPLGFTTQSALTSLRITSASCTWYNSPDYTLPNSTKTSRIHVQFNGNTGDGYGIYAYSPNYGWYWPINQQTVPSGTIDTWMDLPYPTTVLRTYAHDCGTGGAATQIPDYIVSSPTAMTVEYSTNGTTWSSSQTGNGSGTASIPVPANITPANKYQVALSPTALPNSGALWRSVNTTWYSPLWREFIQNDTGTVQQNSIQLWWATGEYSDTSRPKTTQRVVLSRDGSVIGTLVPGTNLTYALQTQYGRYDYWTNYTDTGLEPGRTYNYSACVLNVLDACGKPVTWTVSTLPDTPDATLMDVQYGSSGWVKTATATSWGEISFKTVRTATSYKLYITGPETRTLTITDSSPEGTTVKYRVNDLKDGGNYTWKLSAVNASGEGGQSTPLTFSTPSRTDSGAPTGGTIQINGGAATTGGTRIKVSGSASDSLSGIAGMQIANSTSGPFSATIPIYDFTTVNLVTYASANSFFTDLGGWKPKANVWAKTVPDSGSTNGTGKIGSIRWDGSSSSRWQGLDLVQSMPVVAGKQYTVQARYQVNGLTSGRVGVFSGWMNGASTVAAADHMFSTTNGSWTTETWTLTAPETANARSLMIGFDQANAGATILVDYITVNEGSASLGANNILPNPATGEAEWTIDGSSFGAKTVYAKYMDRAGNVSAVVSSSIQFMLTDTTAPRVSMTINGAASGATTSTPNVLLQITATDDQSSPDMLKMRFSNDGNNWSQWEPYAPLKQWTICSGLSASGCEGLRTVWVEVQDAAMQKGGTIATVFFRQNSTPVSDPTTVWPVTGSTGNFNTGSGTIAVQFQRLTEATIQLDLTKLGGAKTIRYGYDPSRYSQWETIQATKTFNLPNVQGIQTIYIQTDNGQQFQLKFLLDYTAPDVSLSWGGGATMTQPGGKATLVVDALDNLSRNEDLQVSINGGAYQVWANEMQITLPGTGLKNVSVRVKDPAGNVVTKTISIFVVQ